MPLIEDQDLEQILASKQSSPTAEGNSLEEIIVSAPRGYGDKQDHVFLAETRAAMQRVADGEEVDTDAYSAQTKELYRESLRLGLAMDSRRYVGEEAKAILDQSAEDAQYGMFDLSRLRAMDAMSMVSKPMESPEKEALTAFTEVNVPYTIDRATKDALILKDEAMYLMSKRLEGRKWFEFSLENKAMDLAAFWPNPARMALGMGRMGAIAEKGWFGYISLLEQWRSMPANERRAWLPQIEEFAWKAAGEGGLTGPNSIVYSSLMLPFTDENDDFWNIYGSLTVDVIDTATTFIPVVKFLLSATRLRKAAKLTEKSLKLSARLAERGNIEEAGKVVAESIIKKDVDAVIEGSGLKPAVGAENLVDGLERSTWEALRGLVARSRGLTVEKPSDVAIQSIGTLRNERVVAEQAFEEAIVSNGAVVLEKAPMPDSHTVLFTVQAPTKHLMPVSDLKAARASLNAELKQVKNELKLAITSDAPTETKATLLARKAQIDSDLKTVKSALKKHKLDKTITHVAMDGTEIKRIPWTWTVDETGIAKFEPHQVGWYSHIFGTPESRLGKLADNLASTGTLLRQQQRKVFGYFDKSLRKIQNRLRAGAVLKGLHRDSRESVEALLLHGDDIQERFTSAQLREGITVHGLGFKRFDEGEIKAYEEIRDMFDALWWLANKTQVDELTFGGYQQYRVNIFGKDPTKVTQAKAFAKIQRIIGEADDVPIPGRMKFSVPTVGKNKITKAIDTRSGNPIELSKITDLDDGLQKRRYAFVEFRDDIIQGDGSSYRYGLVEVDVVGKTATARGASPIQVALDYRKGYVPKLAQERISHLVVMPHRVIRNGIEEDDKSILRAFDSQREAEIFKQEWLAKHPESKSVPVVEAIGSSWRKQEVNARNAKIIDDRLFRGAFVGHRYDESSLKMGLEGKEVERVNPFESLQRYADFVAVHYPMHEWKQAMIHRFLAQARGYLDVPTRWDSALDSSALNYQELKAMQDHMRVSFSVPTLEETHFSKVQRSLGNSLDWAIWDTKSGGYRYGEWSKKLKGPRNALLESKAMANPWQSLKSASFDLMLGMFNVRQFFIQSAGMFIPASLHPWEVALSTPEFIFLRSAQTAAKDIKTFSKSAKYVKLNPKKMENMLDAWFRSGVPDSVLENADFGYFAGTHGAHYSAGMIHAARTKGRMFYNAGELNNRGMGFVTAFNRMAKKHSWDVTKRLTDEQIAIVNQEALRLGTNMGAANAAKWQSLPIIGLRTQFWQQFHKYYENLFYGLMSDNMRATRGLVKENQWTQKESITALLTNMIGFGMAGYGLDEIMSDYDKWIIDPKGGGLNPEKDANLLTVLRGGMLELITKGNLGWALDISDNVGPASGISMMIEAAKDLVTMASGTWDEGELSDLTLEAIIGASANIGTRVGEAMSRTIKVLTGDTKRAEWDMNTWYAVWSSLAKLTSTWTSLDKARLWLAFNDVTDKKGREMYIVEEGTEIPANMIFARAFGFDPIVLEQKYMVQREETKRKQVLSQRAKAIAASYRMYFSEGTSLVDENEREVAWRMATELKAGLSEAEKARVMEQVYEELDKDYDDYILTLFKAFFDQDTDSAAEREAAQRLRLNSTLTIKGSQDNAE